MQRDSILAGRALAVAALATSLVVPAFSQTILTEGFENFDHPGSGHYLTVDSTAAPSYTTQAGDDVSDPVSWVILGSSIDVVNGGNWNAYAGNQAIDLAGTPGPGGIATDLTNLQVGYTYSVSFEGVAQANNGQTPPQVYFGLASSLGTEGAGNTPWVSNSSLGAADLVYSNYPITSADYGLITETFTATSTSEWLVFESQLANGSNGNVLIDNVSMQVQAVPEPFTIMLGASALGLAARRKIRARA